MVALVFLYPILSTYSEQKVHAAVAGKVINVGAKKVAKEVIQEITWNMATEMVINYKYTPKEGEKPPKQGFELVCLPKDRNENGNCARVIELKKDLSSTDKQVMSSKIETVLEKKITGGVGLNKWTKFLDWLVPISTVLMGATLLDYLIDGDVASLFDEIALEALEESGMLEQVETEDLSQFDGLDVEIRDESTAGFSAKNGKKIIVSGRGGSLTTYYAIFGVFGGATEVGGKTMNAVMLGPPSPLDDMVISTAESSSQMNKDLMALKIGLNENKWKGLVIGRGISIRVEGAPPYVPQELTPLQFDETGLGSNFVPQQKVPIINPNALPMTETGTNIQIVPERQPDGTTIYKKIIVDEVTGTKTKGDPVSQDNISVGDPVKVTTPTGDTVIENPNFDPVVNPAPNPEEPLPPDEETPGEIPNSCPKGLKKPDFKPLTTAFTTSFPFSIPWDLKRLFEAAFSGIGNDRPEFTYEFEFNGQIKKWEIEFPKFFDDWTNFTKPLLLIIFDIGLIYAIYRFTKGGD